MIPGDLSTIQTAINGGLDSTNITATLAQSSGVNQSGQTVKGASNIATSQNTGSTTFTTLATPDQVTGIVLPSPGLIQVLYQATWAESVSGAASSAIFVGANQVVIAHPSGAPFQAAATIGGTANQQVPLVSSGVGLVSTAGATGYTGDVATGQILGLSTSAGGGACMIFAAAGLYTISVQFKVSSGTVTAANRRLYVQALSFT